MASDSLAGMCSIIHAAALFALGCGAVQTTASPESTAASIGGEHADPPSSVAPFQFLNWEVVGNSTERAQLLSAVAEVDRVLASESFWQSFGMVARAQHRIRVGEDYHGDGPAPGYASAEGAIALLRGESGDAQVFSAQVVLTGTYYNQGDEFSGTCLSPDESRTVSCRATEFRQNYSNMLVATHGIGRHRDDEREWVSIEIGRQVFKRFLSDDPFKQSCTFNTLAHEWVHTIGRAQGDHWSIAVDENLVQGEATLTYLFGSVVQCTWLGEHGHIAGTPDALLTCVARFGVDQFNSRQCDD